jgi:phosphatidylinositol 3-kinase
VKYSELPLSAQLAITVWKRSETQTMPVPLVASTFHLFSKGGLLRRGLHKLHLWLETMADESQYDNKTPSKIYRDAKNGLDPELDEIDRLNRLIAKYERGDIGKISWLDPLVFGEIERIKEVRII